MKKFFLILIFIISLCSISNAQPSSVATTIRFGATDPTTCQVNGANVFYNSTSKLLKTCSATNTWSSVGSSGTVTSVSVVSANGFAGTVATATTTPAITISTTITGLLKGNGTAISAASAGTDYVAPGGALFTLNAGTNVGLTVPGAIVQGSTVVIGNTADTVRFTSLGLGQAAPTAGLAITGKTISTDVNGTTASLQTTSTLTKNDSNTRTFQSVQIKPTFNTGGSNLNTTVDILQIDSINTAVTGLTINLLDLMYGGSSKFTVGSAGHVLVEGITSTGATGTGNFVFSASPTFTGTLAAATVTTSANATLLTDDATLQIFAGAVNTGLIISRSNSSSTATLVINESNSVGTFTARVGNAEGSFIFNTRLNNTTNTARLAIGFNAVAEIGVASNTILGFASTVNAAGTIDTAFTRISAGLMGVGTGAAGSFAADLKFNNALVTSTTDSTTTTTGALQVAGGAAIRKRVFIDGITQSSGLQTAVLCQSSGGEMIADTVACLASSARFKENIKPLNIGLDAVMKLKPVSYKYKPEGIFTTNLNFHRERVGLIAEEVAKVDSRFVGFEADNFTPRTVGYDAMVPLLIKAIQELQVEIVQLKHDLVKVQVTQITQNR